MFSVRRRSGVSGSAQDVCGTRRRRRLRPVDRCVRPAVSLDADRRSPRRESRRPAFRRSASSNGSSGPRLSWLRASTPIRLSRRSRRRWPPLRIAVRPRRTGTEARIGPAPATRETRFRTRISASVSRASQRTGKRAGSPRGQFGGRTLGRGGALGADRHGHAGPCRVHRDADCPSGASYRACDRDPVMKHEPQQIRERGRDGCRTSAARERGFLSRPSGAGRVRGRRRHGRTRGRRLGERGRGRIPCARSASRRR